MSKFDNKKIMPRYFAIAVVLTLTGIAILCKAAYIMSAKKEYWTEVAARLKSDSLSVKPTRGNILSCDGRLMASSIPEYRIFMDFKAGGEKKDSVWRDSIDVICEGLHRIFPSKTAKEFKQHLEKGHAKMSRNWPIWKKRIDYNTFTEVKKLPVFNMSKYKGGFHWEEFNSRRRPFGSLAQRTVGDMFGAKDTARFGLELSYDSILRGKNGLIHRRKILNKFMSIPIMPPDDGADIVTTIDVGMQDLAERALVEELKEINGNVGVVILMEVETGDIKAIVNMVKCADGGYRETVNKAISHRCEPGSVFKVASFLVALDDGVVDTSSNIGVSHVIDKFYFNNPEKYVDGLHRVGIAEDLQLPLVGYTPPIIRRPHKNSRGQYDNWSKTALAWMSIGYETQVAPINTVTFYNAIANNGRMMRPRFVKKVIKNGETLKEYPPEVIKEQIAKPQTIKTMQTILEHVVSQGLGKKAGSPMFKVAGKTGTAQVSKGKAGYKSGTVDYWLSFAGFFPADKPRYSCIVCIEKSGLPASGGGMSGVVFHHIAEGVMAKHLKMSVDDARDTSSVMIPDVKNGNIMAADYVLGRLDIKTDTQWEGSYAYGNPIWGKAARHAGEVTLTKTKTPRNIVPDVKGMGARDAVYMLESRGLTVKVQGRGKVKSQSYAPGRTAISGAECVLVME